MNTSLFAQRARAGLQQMFVADALSMPVHWFYDPQDIQHAFPGSITRFEDAPSYHPASFLQLPEQNDKCPQVVGNVILKGKEQFWNQPHRHVHQGMKAGENTLNLHCARVAMRCLLNNQGRYNPQRFIDSYIAFMTANPPRHPDTYAEAYHRDFFCNLEKGIPSNHCGAPRATTASIGGLVTVGPVAIVELCQDTNLTRVQTVCREHLFLTHPDEGLAQICDAYVALIAALLFRADAEPQNLIALTAKQSAHMDVIALTAEGLTDNQVIGERYGKSCEIKSAWPGLLYLAYKYLDDPQAGLLANTNLGGENCHRGAVLGMILGLATADGLDDMFDQLSEAREMSREIGHIVECLPL